MLKIQNQGSGFVKTKNMTSPYDNLRPEGWVETEPPAEFMRTPGSNNGKARYDALKPEGWVETERALVDRPYVPETLRGTEYEADAPRLEKLLFSRKEQGFETAVALDRGKLQWALEQFKGVAPDVAAKGGGPQRLDSLRGKLS